MFVRIGSDFIIDLLCQGMVSTVALLRALIRWSVTFRRVGRLTASNGRCNIKEGITLKKSPTPFLSSFVVAVVRNCAKLKKVFDCKSSKKILISQTIINVTQNLRYTRWGFISSITVPFKIKKRFAISVKVSTVELVRCRFPKAWLG